MRHGPQRRALGVIGTAVLALGLVAGCAVPVPGSPSNTPSVDGQASVAPSAGESSAEPTGPGGSADASAPPALVPYDQGLLAILPDDLDGIVLNPDPDTSETVGADPELARVASAVASAFAYDATTDEFVVANVVQLEPGIFDDAFYRDWRDTYDEGACSQADGVTGHATARIGGRETFIGTCGGGVRTYHVAIPDKDLIVSVSALGDRRLGEKVIERLDPDAL